MITPESAKHTYHFTDADKEQDSITLNLIGSIQYTGRNLFISITTLMVILFVSAGLIVYQMSSGFSPVYTVIAGVLLFMYIPRCTRVWREYGEASGIRYDKNAGSHFLLCQAHCLKKNPPANRAYSLKVKSLNGAVLDQALVPKRTYDQVQEKDRLILAYQEGGAGQVIAFPAACYQDAKKALEKGAAGPVSLRPLTEQEARLAGEQYLERRRQRARLYYKNYGLIILACGAVFTVGILRLSNVLIYPPLFVIVLLAGVFFMDYDEDRHVRKSLAQPEALSCAKARVGLRTRDNANGYQIYFHVSSDSRPVYISKKREDYEWFHTGDNCLLVYIGKERPLPFKIKE